MGWSITFPWGATTQFLQNPGKSGIQTFEIRRHCSQFKITMGLSFVYGAQKR
jgi:hypothetical protein